MLGRLSESEETELSSFLGRAWSGRGRVWDFSNWLGPQMLVGNEHGHQAESQSCRLAHLVRVTGKLQPDPGTGPSSFFFKILIYFYFVSFWLCWVFIAAHRLCLVAASEGYSLVVV